MELLFLLIICPLIFMLGRYYLSRFQYRVPKPVTIIIFAAFVVSFLLFLSTFYLAKHNLYYWGYRSHSLIFIISTILGVLYFFLRPDFYKLSGWEFLPLILTVFLVAFSSILVYGVLWHYKNDLLYRDNKYRLERTGWFITPCKLPTLFVRDGVFEKGMLYTENYCLSKNDIDSVKIIQGFDDTVVVTFFHHSDWKDMPKPIIIKAFRK